LWRWKWCRNSEWWGYNLGRTPLLSGVRCVRVVVGREARGRVVVSVVVEYKLVARVQAVDYPVDCGEGLRGVVR
jgi:hypothetical protein